METEAELRYYEILFIKTLSQFHTEYKLDKLSGFIEMACYISGADITQVTLAAQRVLTNDPRIKILRDEYIVCLKLFSGMNDSQIRRFIKCSPNTIALVMQDYKDAALFIAPRFERIQTDNIYIMLKAFRGLGQIY